MSRKEYESELTRLEVELVKLQGWVQHKGLKIVVLFEGRDSAGKGGTIKRITYRLNPRLARVVALPKATEREKYEWYFQRYIRQLPTAGEMVLFDSSWYNRAGVEKVMGFCTDEQHKEFYSVVNGFELVLERSGIQLIRYWLDIDDDMQEKRFQQRISDPRRQWKLSPMDVEAQSRWVDYSRARDVMLERTSTDYVPWFLVDANVKRHARLNLISHPLSQVLYEDLTPEPIELPPRQEKGDYEHPDFSEHQYLPAVYPKPALI